MQWVRDRRYVVDRGVATSTGITASVPLMLALVEALEDYRARFRHGTELKVRS